MKNMKLKTCGFATAIVVVFYQLMIWSWNIFIVAGIVWLIVYHQWSIFTLFWVFIITAKSWNIKITPDELSFTKPIDTD